MDTSFQLATTYISVWPGHVCPCDDLHKASHAFSSHQIELTVITSWHFRVATLFGQGLSLGTSKQCSQNFEPVTPVTGIAYKYYNITVRVLQ